MSLHSKGSPEQSSPAPAPGGTLTRQAPSWLQASVLAALIGTPLWLLSAGIGGESLYLAAVATVLLAFVYVPRASRWIVAIEEYAALVSSRLQLPLNEARSRVWGSKGPAWAVVGIAQCCFVFMLVLPLIFGWEAVDSYGRASEERAAAARDQWLVEQLTANSGLETTAREEYLSLFAHFRDQSLQSARVENRMATAYLGLLLIAVAVMTWIAHRSKKKRGVARLIRRASTASTTRPELLRQAVETSMDTGLIPHSTTSV